MIPQNHPLDSLKTHNFNQTIGSLAGAGNVTLGTGTLSTGGDNTSTTFSGVISGAGGLTKQGLGEFFLTGNSNYTGPTNINGGILSVNGSIVSPVFINSGGTLGGTGSVGSTTVNAGGTLAPGDAIGTLTVNGNLTFNAGSTYLISVLGSTNDRTNVTGAASLTGTVDALFLSTNLMHSYTILSAAGGRSNTFGALDVFGLPSFLGASLFYTPTEVDLLVNSMLAQIPGLNQNQQAVAGALDFSFNHGGGTLGGLFGLSAAQIPFLLTNLSGEGISGTQETAFGASNLFISTMMQQGAFWRGGDELDPIGTAFGPSALSYASDPSQPAVYKALPKAPVYQPRLWRAWMTGFDATWKLDGEQAIGSAGLSHRTAGGAGGFDYQVNPGLLVGLALGGTASSFSVPDRATSGTVDGAHLGGYGVATLGSLYWTGAASFAAFDDRINRTIAGIGPAELANGRFTSSLFSARFETGNKWSFGNVALTPFAAVQVSELWQRGFSESSTALGGAPGVEALNVAAQAVTSVPTFVGAQLDTRIVLFNGAVLSPYLRASWVHEFNPTRNLTATFETLPLATFTVDGPRAARDAGRIEVGSKVSIARNAWLYGSFDGEFSSRSQMYAGRGGVKVSW